MVALAIRHPSKLARHLNWSGSRTSEAMDAPVIQESRENNENRMTKGKDRLESVDGKMKDRLVKGSG